MPTKRSIQDCEIFRSFNRLEPRARKAEFQQSLRAEIADPLWMLARQWQFGEFKGDDGGSPVFAKLLLDTTSIARVKMGSAPASPYQDRQPLEQWVESEPAPHDLRSRAAAGQQWLRILRQKMTVLAPTADFNEYVRYGVERFGYALPETGGMANDLPVEIEQARRSVNAAYRQFMTTLHGRGMDGMQLYQTLEIAWDETVNALVLHAEHRHAVQAAVTDFVAWYEKKYDNAPLRNSAWDAAALEYRFGVALPEKNAPNTILAASEYYTGHLDWYNFDVQPAATAPADLTAPIPSADQYQGSRLHTLIPAAARYAGMPNKRWWEFEESAVDLGNINAQTTDIAKIILMEYALMYGNDWFVIPFELPAGSLSSIPGLVVTDVFGVRSFIRPATQGQTDDWSSWGMFNLSPQQTSLANGVRQTDTRLFLPPVTARTLEGQPLEKVLFVRDEMANMVWAIEDTLPDHVGGSLDGLAAAVALTERLQTLDGSNEQEYPVAENAALQWQLGNTVPENWIPFIPIHLPGQNRAVQLQRAAMPRLFRNEFTATRPQSAILRVGMQNDSHVQLHPYYVHEEEVPRAGCRIVALHQRTRWYGGKVLNWYGRYKTTGRGEGSSGLRYDSLRYVQQGEQR